MHYVWGVLVVLIALFFLFATIGMFIQKQSNRSKTICLIITVVLGGVGINLLGGKSAKGASSIPATSKPKTVTVKPNPKPKTATSQPTVDPQKVAEAKEAMNKFDNLQKEYQDDLSQFQSIINGLSNGTLDAATAYNDLGSLSTQTLNTFTDADTMSVSSQYNNAQNEMSIAIADLRDAIDQIKKYLNDQKVSEMATAQTDLKQSESAYENVSVMVASQALEDGYNVPNTTTKKSK